uniref:Uncharacterized protein n=1 Tax=Aster yellows phytoplasma TaxID=35779 RepID=Q849C2_ASTYP|nr:hypothetical protein [Aster yellows phytoplasma]
MIWCESILVSTDTLQLTGQFSGDLLRRLTFSLRIQCVLYAYYYLCILYVYLYSNI